jgi:serine protease Do
MSLVATAVIALGALAAACGLSRPAAPTRQEMLARILPSAVQIVLEQREGRLVRAGSGVVIADGAADAGVDCLILTSGHVLAGLEGQVQVFALFGRDRGPGTKVPAAVVGHRDTGRVDLALLRARTSLCAPSRQGPPPALGEPVWVVAFPWGRGMTLASGIVSQVSFSESGDAESGSRLMVDALVSYGSSGAGVFASTSGELIGVVEGYRTARLTAQGGDPGWYIDVPVPGQTFVTPMADVRRFLEDLGFPDLARSTRPATQRR